MNCALFDEYIKAVYDDKTWPNRMKPGVLAWSIAEQGENRFVLNGMGELARKADNYHSLHQRPEMAAVYPCVYHKMNTTEKDNAYVDFPCPADELRGLHLFIHRPVYGNVDSHMGSFEELLKFLCNGTPSFCPTKGYVERVLSFLPEAEMELRKLGWTPEDEPVAVEPPIVLSTDYNIAAGTLNGPNVHYFPVKNYDHWYRRRTDGIIVHGTGCLPGTSNLVCTKCGIKAPGVIAAWNNPAEKKSAPVLIMPDGALWQTMDLRIVAWHCYGYNNTKLGIELINIGPFYKWQEILGWFYRFKGKPWQQGIRKSEMVLLNNVFYQNYTDYQYNTLNGILPPIKSFFNEIKTIAGHSNYDAAWDPGPTFQWYRVI